MDRLILSVVAGVLFFFAAIWITALFHLDLAQIALSVAIGFIGGVAVWLIDWMTGRNNAA